MTDASKIVPDTFIVKSLFFIPTDFLSGDYKKSKLECSTILVVLILVSIRMNHLKVEAISLAVDLTQVRQVLFSKLNMTENKNSLENNLKGFVNLGFVEEKNGILKEEQIQDSSQDRQDEHSVKPLSYFSLFQYSTRCEKCCVAFAIILSMISGLFPPTINVLYGEFSNLLVDRQYPTDAPSTTTVLMTWFGGGRVLRNASFEERILALREDSLAWGIGCVVLTFCQFLSSMLSIFLLNFIAAQQISRIKILFFKSMICKDLTWFDTRKDVNFAGQISDNMRQLEAGIGGVIGIFAYLMVIFASGVIIAFVYGWKLTLAILTTVPISVGTSSIVAKLVGCYPDNDRTDQGENFIRIDMLMLPLCFGNIFFIEKALSELSSIFTYHLVVAFLDIAICFMEGWLLSLVLMVVTSPMFIAIFINIKIQSRLSAKEMVSYAKAGSVAEEVFGSIRTVAAFEGEEKEIIRYSNNLAVTKRTGVRRGIATGISNGVMWFLIYTSYAIAFAYGVRLVQESKANGDEEYTPAGLLIVFFGVLTGLTNMGFASNHLETFSLACGAASSVYDVINTKPKINSCAVEGNTLEDCKGEIEFRNVRFEYPSRPTIPILDGMNLKIKAGEVVAIVGGSGAGKSTVLQLVQRLYDPSQGEVLLDGENIKSLKVSWLRQQLGVVGQEPLLFATTIRENIWYGMASATEEDIVEAAKQANAHEFITNLKEGYDTVIGQKGSTLSGGQKQRIAIARALVRNPKILLLDEATSALDTVSEKIVQAALDRAAKGRTTLIVTHKLSTIANATRIIVLADGVVAEEGTHSELVAANGLYSELLRSQEKNVRSQRENRTVETASSPPQIVHEEPTLPHPRPHGRYSNLSTFSTIPRPPSIAPPPEESVQYKKVSILELMNWSKPEWNLLIVGAFSSIIAGAALPIVCVLFGFLFGLLSLSDFSLMLAKTDLYAIYLVVVGIVAGICVFLQMYCFVSAGLELTTRLRVKAFDCMVHQDIGWFDDERNKVGALCLRLSKDAAGVQGALGSRVGVIFQAISTMTIGTVVSFFFNWKMTLVTLATIPFVFTGVYLESIIVREPKEVEGKSLERASKIAIEVMNNIKAVASLGKESFFIDKYTQAIEESKRNNFKRAFVRGFAFAIGQTAPFFGYALSLWYGGMLIVWDNIEFKYIIMVSELLIFGAWILGQCVVFAPSFAEAKQAAGKLQYIFERKPEVVDGKISSPPDLTDGGFISFSKVNFAYPTRRNVKVLQDFNILIKAGQSIAIMGPSGSGKSTVVQLLQRFYDPISGSISINRTKITDLKISALRGRLGLVSQEPVLFDRTIEENIAYGDNSRLVSLSEIVAAAKAANIHSFVATLPLGYDTRLGSSGTQLSGGQKQRIAIARALVRNPQILLLDEATSALDSQSEGLVQEALDQASSGRTTITIAHRLGAVKNANLIYVVEKGRIIESGTHEELMRLKGSYYAMHDGEDE